MMTEETSYGVVPLKREGNEWKTLIIMHTKGGFWAFPKGHAENNESSEQAAKRELKEETGLEVVAFLSDKTLSETYSFYRNKQKIHKKVIYFLAEVTGDVVLQTSEVYASRWVNLADAEEEITYKESKSICRQALSLLGGKP